MPLAFRTSSEGAKPRPSEFERIKDRTRRLVAVPTKELNEQNEPEKAKRKAS
jgi:hypothetical protein